MSHQAQASDNKCNIRRQINENTENWNGATALAALRQNQRLQGNLAWNAWKQSIAFNWYSAGPSARGLVGQPWTKIALEQN
jgi:hypothetical protein